MRHAQPRCNRVPCLLGHLELHRPLRLLLHNNCASRDLTALNDVVDTQPNQIATTQLAIDGEVEKRQLSRSMIQPAGEFESPRFP